MERKKTSAHCDYILSIKFSLDSKYLVTASADTTLKTFLVKGDKMDLTPDKTFYGHSQWVWDVVVLPDSNHLLSISSDGFLKCWRLSDGVLLKDNCYTKNSEKAQKSSNKKIKFVSITLKS